MLLEGAPFASVDCDSNGPTTANIQPIQTHKWKPGSKGEKKAKERAADSK
jgi:hypothetical protein